MAQQPEPLAPGDVVAGYRIERRLGRGGMGVVLLARHLHLGRSAAVKVIAPELAALPGFRERFAAEARAAAALRHPHVVTVYDAGEADGVLFLAMQHVDGRDLDAELRAGPIDVARAARIATQVAAALDAAHAAGLVHRDVKPANVLLEGDDAYLSDFGLTDGVADLTPTGRLSGTAAYAAPEQAEGRQADARTDVYALACLVFELLAGRPPFTGDDDAVLHAHVHTAPPRLSEARPGLPPGLDAVLAAGLAKRPADRPASAGAFAAAVHAELAAAGRLGPGGAVPPDRVVVGTADAELRALVRAALAGTPVRIAEAADAAGVVAAASGGATLALVDWALPGGGPTVARALDGCTPVLALCDPDRSSPAAAVADGADDAVATPFSPVQLQVRVRRLAGAGAVAPTPSTPSAHPAPPAPSAVARLLERSSRRAVRTAALVAAGVTAAGAGLAALLLGGGAPEVPDVVAGARGSVLRIEAQRGAATTATGSAWVLDARARLVVTSAHVVNEGERFGAALDGGAARPATVVAAAPCQDLAVLRVPGEGLRTLPGRRGAVRAGEPVVALGFPGSALTATTGVVSAARTDLLDPAADVPVLRGAVQTDTAVNPGSSGGPLVDLDGRLVGVASAARTQTAAGRSVEGMAFAVGAARARAVADRLRAGRSERWTGLTLGYPRPEELAARRLPAGVFVTGAVQGTPAARLGLTGALVTAVDGRRAGTTLASFCDALGAAGAARAVTLTVVPPGGDPARPQRVRVPLA